MGIERFLGDRLKDGSIRWLLTMPNVLDIERVFNRAVGGETTLVSISNEKPEFHEPEGLGLTITMKGKSFDNSLCDDSEKHLVLRKNGKTVAKLNVALILALAADRIKLAWKQYEEEPERMY